MAMKILALDTALNACSVALSDGPVVMASKHEERNRGHAETLLPLIKTLMQHAKMTFEDLDLIAVSVGPGTFTGLRIGLAAARGLSLAAATPCIGITTLEALAASVTPELAQERPIVVAVDARRKEIYLQTFAYRQGDPFPAALDSARAVPVKDAQAHLPKDAFCILGSGTCLLQDAGHLEGRRCDLLDLDSNPDARLIAAIALSKGIPGKNSPPPAPVYLRSPDAKLPGGKDLQAAPSNARSQ